MISEQHAERSSLLRRMMHKVRQAVEIRYPFMCLAKRVEDGDCIPHSLFLLRYHSR